MGEIDLTGEHGMADVITEAARDELERLTVRIQYLERLIGDVVFVMSDDDGGRVLVISEPEPGDPMFTRITWGGNEFTLRPAFDDELWHALNDVGSDTARRALGGLVADVGIVMVGDG